MKLGKSKFSESGIIQQQSRALNGQLTFEENISARRFNAVAIKHDQEITITHGLKRLPNFVQAVRSNRVINFEVNQANTKQITFNPLLPSTFVTKNDLFPLSTTSTIYDQLTADTDHIASGLTATVTEEPAASGRYYLRVVVTGLSSNFRSKLVPGRCVYISGLTGTIGGIVASQANGNLPIVGTDGGVTIFSSSPNNYIYLQTTAENGFTTTSTGHTCTLGIAPSRWEQEIANGDFLKVDSKSLLFYMPHKTAIRKYTKIGTALSITITDNTILADTAVIFTFYQGRKLAQQWWFTFKTAGPTDTPASRLYEVLIGATATDSITNLKAKFEAVTDLLFPNSGKAIGPSFNTTFEVGTPGAGAITINTLTSDIFFSLERESAGITLSTNNLTTSGKSFAGGDEIYFKDNMVMSPVFTRASYGVSPVVPTTDVVYDVSWNLNFYISNFRWISLVSCRTQEFDQTMAAEFANPLSVNDSYFTFLTESLGAGVSVSAGSTFEGTSSNSFMGNLADAITTLTAYQVSLDVSLKRLRVHRALFTTTPGVTAVYYPDGNVAGLTLLASSDSSFFLSDSTNNSPTTNQSRTINVGSTNGFTPGTKFYIIKTDGTIDQDYIVSSVSANTITYTDSKNARISQALEILQVSEATINILVF